VWLSGQEIVCRYNIGTGDLSGGLERPIRDPDMRFTVVDRRPKWQVAPFPYAPASQYTSALLAQLMSTST
jgi:hypothetical protein